MCNVACEPSARACRCYGYRFETCRVPVAVRDRLPFVPFTVNVNVPRGVAAVLIVKRDVAVGVTEVGLNEPDDPDGSPLTDSETAPPNPLSDVTVTV